jgi:hypothetical protein
LEDCSLAFKHGSLIIFFCLDSGLIGYTKFYDLPWTRTTNFLQIWPKFSRPLRGFTALLMVVKRPCYFNHRAWCFKLKVVITADLTVKTIFITIFDSTEICSDADKGILNALLLISNGLL